MNPAENVISRARAWLVQDPDPKTRAELAELIDMAVAGSRDAEAALQDQFDHRLGFGTAGLRGPLGAGPNRMNRVLVAQTAAGLARFLLEKARPGEHPSVVIGFDGRKNSAIFAEDSAEIFSGLGLEAILLPRMLPTPVLAFAVQHLGTDAGVMVTASHNPGGDNGYKVYLGGADHGSQIVSPIDLEIAAQIQDAATGSILDLPRGEYQIASEEVWDAYVTQTARITSADPAPLNWVYTAMHGVGWETLNRVLTQAGFAAPTLVREQIEPDPTFPTVKFPNPEEPGALDLSFATARQVGAELIIANDPDADRLAVAIPDAQDPSGFRRLSGNEVGILLGNRAAERAGSSGNTASGNDPAATLACSIVSSPALAVIARHHGLEYTETLTGFKWISRVPGLVYGFEEALGYLVNPETVRDKDGISATLAFLDLTAELNLHARTVSDLLDELVAKFGAFESAQISIRARTLSLIPQMMSALRTQPPTSIGGAPVERIDDLSHGFNALPASDVLRIWLRDGSRIMVRPSGTEPKLKVYLDTQCDTGTVAERRAVATTTLTQLTEGMRELLGAQS